MQLLGTQHLLEGLERDNSDGAHMPPLLANSQDRVCQAFTSWVQESPSAATTPARLTAGHAPALLAFAASALLSRDIPGFSGECAAGFCLILADFMSH